MDASPSSPPRTIEVFYSYAHTDEPLRNELAKHLSLLRRQGVIAGWHDRRITAGTEWAGAIDTHLQRAQIILLLVSADFLASNYCYEVEVQRAMARHETGEARVIPIILRAVDWHSAPFGTLQALPTDGRPITSWPNQDEAFRDVALGIRAVAEEGAVDLVPVVTRDNVRRTRNRRELLDEVKGEVEDRLAQSPHRGELIPLRKELQPRQLARPWDVEVILDTREPTQLPPETAMIEVFDREAVAGQLLILGAPGAGKTTELLQLARELIRRAEADPRAPIPVLINLSSWKDDQPLASWLVAELSSKYGVRRDVGRQWLEESRLALLLDGLDELEAPYQAGAVQALNQLRHDYHPPHLVVCCRTAEYEHSGAKLRLNGAVCLYPLTAGQIQAALHTAGLPALWQSIQADPELFEAATSPLLLSMLIVVFEDAAPQARQELHSAQQRRHALFQGYIHRMLSRTALGQTYAREKTLRWLSALANMLNTHGQDEFLLEKLQPTWLPSRVQRWEYHAGVILTVAVSVGIVTWLHGHLVALLPKGPLTVVGEDWLIRHTDMESWDPWFSLPLILGLALGLLIGMRWEIRPVETLRWSSANAWDGMVQGWRRAFPIALRYGVYFGIITGTIGGVSYFLSDTSPRLTGWGTIEGIIGAISMVLAGVVAMRIVRLGRWPRGGLRRLLTSAVINAVIKGLIAGVAAGLGTGLITWLMGGLLLKAITQGLVAWMGGWLLGGLSVGMSVGLAMGLLARLRGTTRVVEPFQGTRPVGWPRLVSEVSHGLKVGAGIAIIASLLLGVLVASGILSGRDDLRKVITVAVLPLFILILVLVFLLMSMLAGWILCIGIGPLISSLFGALSRGLTGPDILRRTAPNQGIWQSAANMGLFALLGGPTVGLIWGLVNMTQGILLVRVAPTTADWVRLVMLNVVLLGAFSALVPGAACLQHFTLRFILWWNGRAPWHYARFLDYATERRLLQRVGGRYRFIHDLLRGHFAALEPTQAPRS